ncbi:MAG: AAA family ATPase, partial [Anaerolineales bacterium]|nr:AAA family ATPase [Anaerolineales bacterium]
MQTLYITTGDGQLLDLGSPTTKSLFAYLVLQRAQPLDRRRLAFLFWPRGTEASARRNLRQYLHRIRRALEPIDPDGRFLNTAGHNIHFTPPADFYLDVADFETACTPPHADLPRAIALYSGDLLEDIYDDWVEPERERLARLYRQALAHLIDQYQRSGHIREAIPYAEGFLAAEPLLEHAYVRLMQLHYAVGDRGRVTQQYEQLTMMLADELGAEPLPETAVLYQSMLAGEYVLPETSSIASQPVAVATPIVKPAPETAVFIGRAPELDWLDQAIQQARQARGGFYYLQGESGVGKTRLVEEWLQQQERPFHLFAGRAYEFESMIPYAPLAQALRSAAQEKAIPWELFQPPPPWLASLTPLLPDLPAYFPGQTLPVSTNQQHIIESLGNFLLTLARQRLLVLFLDNLHWADTPTWNFLGYLAQRVAHLPLLLLATARAEDMPEEPARLLRKLQRQQQIAIRPLHRLSQTETDALVRGLMPANHLDPVFLRRIYEETEGNPFFIIETIRAVREAGGDWTESVPTDASGKRPFFAIPLQVQAVIEARLDKLSEASRAALGVAAAIGREFDFRLLQAVSQDDTETLLNALDEWLARGLVRETRDGYDFTHEKLSQVAYEQLSRARRQWIHGNIADFLAANQPDVNPAQLAHHYYLSSEPGRALPYLAQAGQRALSVRSYAEAREFGLRAIGLLGRAPRLGPDARAERIDLNLQLAQAYAFTGALPKALTMLQETERTAEALDDVGRLARIFRRSAQIFWLQG